MHMTCIVLGGGAALLLASLAILYKGLNYHLSLRKVKADYSYQIMSFRLLKSVCEAAGDERFLWGGFGKKCLLFYRSTNRHTYLIDTPFLDAFRFRCWQRSNQRRKERNKVASNETNAVLQDIQRILEQQIEENSAVMRKAAVQRGQIIDQLTPFMADYVKSQIEIEG